MPFFVALVCKHYSYKLNEALELPFKQLLYLVKHARIFECQSLIDQCDIQVISITQSEWYLATRARFENTLKVLNSDGETPRKVQTPVKSEAIENEGAKVAMFHLARSLRESKGYGAR